MDPMDKPMNIARLLASAPWNSRTLSAGETVQANPPNVTQSPDTSISPFRTADSIRYSMRLRRIVDLSGTYTCTQHPTMTTARR